MMRFSEFKELIQATVGTALIMAALLSLCLVGAALWRILT